MKGLAEFRVGRRMPPFRVHGKRAGGVGRESETEATDIARLRSTYINAPIRGEYALNSIYINILCFHFFIEKPREFIDIFRNSLFSNAAMRFAIIHALSRVPSPQMRANAPSPRCGRSQKIATNTSPSSTASPSAKNTLTTIPGIGAPRWPGRRRCARRRAPSGAARSTRRIPCIRPSGRSRCERGSAAASRSQSRPRLPGSARQAPRARGPWSRSRVSPEGRGSAWRSCRSRRSPVRRRRGHIPRE